MNFHYTKGMKLIKKDKCSTGSYILLKNGDDQQWMFKTPKGEFRIQGKTTSPVWKKPDWAFVEEGITGSIHQIIIHVLNMVFWAIMR